MAELKKSLLKIVSEKWINPPSPTPPSFRYYKFSALDVDMLDMFTRMVFFYPKENFHHSEKYSEETNHRQLFDYLETSLSKTLTRYFLFARIFMGDDITVDCNDTGVQLWEVEVQASMSDILDNRVDYHPWNVVILPEMYSSLKSHVKIQPSYFECGRNLCDSFFVTQAIRRDSNMQIPQRLGKNNSRKFVVIISSSKSNDAFRSFYFSSATS